MSKQNLPTYSISTLREAQLSPKDFVADHFAHYLDEHKNLKFPHKHSFYHLVYFTKGSGSHSIDFVTFPVDQGQIYFMAPGQVHSWDFTSKSDGYIVNFSEEYINALVADPRYLDQFNFFSGIAAEQVIIIPEEDRRRVEQTLETIVTEGKSKEALKDDFARTALLQLLILVSRYEIKEDRKEKSSYNSVVLRNFKSS
ncbi:AraC family ligand binding domain-containing protein [Aridibaculum aurantiacum]|uniref:AraC family ligand binding domain-containing protein n=1 Tax=Aridibaculum aurantiacum TaxID=2810307 RepID=UPI001F61E2F2|nr:AraC family ligand binding domain-containing protein [Aridibaculum aurantiacum]